MGTIIMCHACTKVTNHHKSAVREYFKKQNILQGLFSTIFFTGTKTKTRHICKDLNHILTYFFFCLANLYTPPLQKVTFLNYLTNVLGALFNVLLSLITFTSNERSNHDYRYK